LSGALALGLNAPIAVRTDRWLYDAAKRVLDVILTTVALILGGPVIAVIAILIRRDSPGPALFTQPRVGQTGRIFTFYKFRSMYVDSQERYPELFEVECRDDEILFYKRPEDPRVTPFGRFLRKSSLDELPNLFNVLRGDMSLVGPRPELLEFIPFYTPAELAKFSVRSGITGLAQTSGRGRLPVREQIRADLEYVAKQSIWLDLVILMRTVRQVLRRDGAF
jgi:lipopolysaccharide/colanic/teichoic acid biosynthesis glycosyltransferase